MVGVPDTVPDPLIPNPGGNDPELSDHLYGVLPPVAPSAPLYAVCVAPFAKVVVVIATGVAAA